MMRTLWLLVALWLLAACGLTPSATQTSTSAPATGLIKRSMGDPNAPIKMQEFSDYQ